jgi:hypothetical protein
LRQQNIHHVSNVGSTMQCALALALVASMACSHSDERVRSEALPVVAPQISHPEGAPPSGTIIDVALAEEGNAALTLDVLGGLRLWPTLDGTIPPVPLRATAGRQLALARADHGFLAAILNDAGAAVLLVLGRDGAICQRVPLPSDVEIDEILAVDRGILVRRRDQTIERYDATGARTGRIGAAPGTRIAELASRRGAAIAGITRDGKRIDTLRPIAMDGELRWGDAIPLSEPLLVGALALSPDHTHAAGVLANPQIPVVIDLTKRGIATHLPGRASANGGLGFTDNDTLAVVLFDGTLAWSRAPFTEPPIATTFQLGGELELGDHVACAAVTGGLAVAQP